MKLYFDKIYKRKDIKFILTQTTHIKHLLNYSTNKHFYKYLEYKVFDKKTAKNYFEKRIRDKKMYYFSIYLKNKIIGTIALRKLNYKKKSCQISYGLSPNYWGKGLFTEVVKLVIKLLKINKFKSVKVYTRYDNFGSIAGLIKNNFKILKIFKNFYFDKKTRKNHDAISLELKL